MQAYSLKNRVWIFEDVFPRVIFLRFITFSLHNFRRKPSRLTFDVLVSQFPVVKPFWKLYSTTKTKKNRTNNQFTCSLFYLKNARRKPNEASALETTKQILSEPWRLFTEVWRVMTSLYFNCSINSVFVGKDDIAIYPVLPFSR